jgi:hypothetical protein
MGGYRQADAPPSPPPSTTHVVKLRPAIAHIAWDRMASESPTGKLVWSVIYSEPQSPPSPLARRHEDLTPRLGPPNPHVFPLVNPSQNLKQSMICQLRGAVCSPSLSGPKTSPLSTLRGQH